MCLLENNKNDTFQHASYVQIVCYSTLLGHRLA